ncbi:hypothetical protein HZS_3528 [Henneguya salminicola]|nr:hypothetical protein HZS_3528 [Henneguya salminicola]
MVCIDKYKEITLYKTLNSLYVKKIEKTTVNYNRKHSGLKMDDSMITSQIIDVLAELKLFNNDVVDALVQYITFPSNRNLFSIFLKTYDETLIKFSAVKSLQIHQPKYINF